MSNKLIIITAAVVAAALLAGCPQQYITRKIGGEQTITLEKNQRLVNITWKDQNLWILTREREENESPRTYTYKENSLMGILEGQITIKEK